MVLELKLFVKKQRAKIGETIKSKQSTLLLSCNGLSHLLLPPYGIIRQL
jgi:hypothetical protein